MLRDTIDKNRQNLTTLTTLFVILKDFIEMKNDGRGQNGLTFQEISEKYRILLNDTASERNFIQRTFRDRQMKTGCLKKEPAGTR
jgi:hypothetical protein